ncbi:MAG: peptidylprolyl isomerase [Massilia sp.]
MSTRALIRVLACALLLTWQLHAGAQPAVAARINAQPVYGLSVDAMWRMAQAAQPTATRQATLNAIIENRLLAGAARAQVGVAALSSGQGVGFARDVAQCDQLVATLRTLYGVQIEADIRQLPGGTLMALVQDQPALDGATLTAIFGDPSRLQLVTALDPVKLALARKIVALRYALPRRETQSITLFDVYQRQNVQGRVALFAHDVDFMRQQATLLVGARFVLDWSERHFGKAAVNDLSQVLSEQADAQVFMRMHGMGAEQNGDSSLLDGLARTVTPDQVRSYYRAHQGEFVRIARVRARHIRLPDEASARKVAQGLAGGADFAATARRYSIASDAGEGGALGWVRHEGTPGWLAQLVFSQPEGKISQPIRMPGGPDVEAAWEIVLVERREQGMQPADSESVRYIASRAVAREMAAVQFIALRKDLLRKARIELTTVPSRSGAAS